MGTKHLGYSEDERTKGPFARFYDPRIGPLQPQVTEALLIGRQAHELFPGVDAAATLTEPGYWPVETGYTRSSDGGISVFCLTDMPRVEPKMWDWWFGWHGSEALRYKLWHPKAHVDARWADGRDDEAYIGRTSNITEYLGPSLKKAAISFRPPSDLGIDEDTLARQNEVVICARVGMPNSPLRAGWLLHQLRPIDGGSEMRSRMWFGGENAAIGDRPGLVQNAVIRLLNPIAKSLLPDPAELLVHNAQEMAHLAGFLPELYAEFGSDREEASQ